MHIDIQGADELTLDAREPLASMYVLSPYVWREDHRLEIAVRAVNRSNDPLEKFALIYHGVSDDGLTFRMDDEPILAPGPDDIDIGGCEDPSVVKHDGYRVFYSGYNPVRSETRLLVAAGESLHALTKRGDVFPEGGFANTKEATVVRAPDNSWRIFFEYAAEERSKIGVGRSSELSGPWTLSGFSLHARRGSWDDWHLSPGPVVRLPSRRSVMFYNGASKKPAWRIGWAELDVDCLGVNARGDDFIIEPGPVADGTTDIAFAASAIWDGDLVHLYYSVSDLLLMRAIVRIEE